MFDVVRTTIYRYQRAGDADAVDRTLALKLRAEPGPVVAHRAKQSHRA